VARVKAAPREVCLPVIVAPSIQRRRPTDTMSLHEGMNGATCFVEAQSASSNSYVGMMRAKWPSLNNYGDADPIITNPRLTSGKPCTH
jgi:hypothetical protein